MNCGIYKITCKETGKCYVGQTKNIKRRWATHKKRFPSHLFNYEIIVQCFPESLDFWERRCIEDEKSLFPNGFNLKKGGQGWDMIFSDETRKKLSEAGKKADHSRNGGGPGSKAGGLSQMKSGIHNMLKNVICPHCSKTGMSRIMKRWHFDNCKRKLS